MGQTFLEFDQRRRAEDIVAETKTLAERSGQPNLLILAMCNDAVMAFWDGFLEEVVAIRRIILTRAEQPGTLEFATAWATWTLPPGCNSGIPAGLSCRCFRARESCLGTWPVRRRFYSVRHISAAQRENEDLLSHKASTRSKKR
jgi:hypothetical protein